MVHFQEFKVVLAGVFWCLVLFTLRESCYGPSADNSSSRIGKRSNNDYLISSHKSTVTFSK